MNFSTMLIEFFPSDSMPSAPSVVNSFPPFRYVVTSLRRYVPSSLLPSSHRMPVLRRISPRRVIFQLPLNIPQHTACPKPEHLRIQPGVSELFLYQRQPFQRLLSRPNPSRRLESHSQPGFERVLTDRPRHYQSHRKRSVSRFFSRRSLDKVRAGHHGYTLARATFRNVSKSPVPKITFICAGPQAARNVAISSNKACHRPPNTCARVITTSISCAPASTDRRISATRSSRGDNPAGNPVDTAATLIPLPSKARSAVSTNEW